MSDVVIKVEGLSKRYRIGQYVGGGVYQYRALRDVLTDVMYAPFRRLRARSKQRAIASNPTADSHEPSANFIWALKDVSLEVKQGEIVGVIGRNGAGKTTLLKVLSRITEPTEGRAGIKGRVGSLLEVGTGFHPELTGRENVYLSGAVLGMTKKEIDRKFDEIVDFSGVEKFIDTPVKRYSSGMLVRLGFAVAAHLEPEILLIDEVLAVGDVEFQKKCLGKMNEVAGGGRTVLFVSHSMNYINRLCPRTILLENGCISDNGKTCEVVQHYLNIDNENLESKVTFDDDPQKSYQILSASVRHPDGSLVERKLEVDEPFVINLQFKLSKPLPGGFAMLGIKNQSNEVVLLSDTRDSQQSVQFETPRMINVEIPFPAPLLVPGKYTVSTKLVGRDRHGVCGMEKPITFEICDVKGVREKRVGYINIPLEWTEEV